MRHAVFTDASSRYHMGYHFLKSLFPFSPLELARLPSNGSTDAKDCIRRAISPQLCDLWNQDTLKHEREKFLNLDYELTAVREVAGKSFSCVVNAKNFLVASLDIMFLRPEEPGLLVTQGGDIDNRMKTLLDALAIGDGNGSV